jgi:hypothetical protein
MKQHLQQRNLSYREHFSFASRAGLILILAGIASIVHAVFPNVFTSYSERKTTELAELAKQRRNKT